MPKSTIEILRTSTQLLPNSGETMCLQFLTNNIIQMSQYMLLDICRAIQFLTAVPRLHAFLRIKSHNSLPAEWVTFLRSNDLQKVFGALSTRLRFQSATLSPVWNGISTEESIRAASLQSKLLFGKQKGLWKDWQEESVSFWVFLPTYLNPGLLEWSGVYTRDFSKMIIFPITEWLAGS